MWGCRNIEGLMAASFYEPLSPAEDSKLQRHLAKCAECHAEYASLRQLVTGIPRTEVPFSGDLWPALRGQLDQPRSSATWRWISTAGFAACAALLLFLSYGALKPAASTPGTTQVASSAVSGRLQEAAALREAHQYEQALHV